MTITIKNYRISSPTPNGNAFWTVLDIEEDKTLASIFKDVPNAEDICLKIVESLTK